MPSPSRFSQIGQPYSNWMKQKQEEMQLLLLNLKRMKKNGLK
jgi:hypothetical protein